MNSPRLALGTLAALVLTATGCAWFEPAALPPPSVDPDAPPAAAPPDIVLITLDTTRADHLKRYGYFRDTAPRLEKVADGALVFDQLIVPMATTLPTHTSLLTGVWPHEHGVLANVEHGGQRFIPSERLQGLATILGGHGYQTAAFTSAAPLNTESGIQRGFETFSAASKAERSGDQTTGAALAWLADAPAKPMFLWVHYYDPHNPWTAPEKFKNAFGDDAAAIDAWITDRQVSKTTRRPTGEAVHARPAIQGYDAEIAFMDAQISRLLDGLAARGRMDNTLLVVVGDHGEGLNEHGEPGHGLVWQEQLHAPLFIVAPGATPRRVPAVLSVADVFPTALALVDVPGEAEFLAQASGKDVLASGFTTRPVLSQTSTRQLKFGVPMTYTMTGDRLKCAWRDDGTAVLWDHSVDPYELAPVQDPTTLAACVADGKAVVEAQKAHGALLGGHMEKLSTEELQRLIELGYLSPDALPPVQE